MRVIGIDPGYAITGFGVVENAGSKLKMLDGGVIETNADTPFPQRLESIYNALDELIAVHCPQIMAVEELFISKNKTTAVGTAQARGVILLAAAKHCVPVFEYTPMQVKKAVTGYGGAGKGQVQLMVQRLLSLPALPKPDDMADALAIAMCQFFVGADPRFIAQSGYQRQARKARSAARINLGKLAGQAHEPDSLER